MAGGVAEASSVARTCPSAHLRERPALNPLWTLRSARWGGEDADLGRGNIVLFQANRLGTGGRPGLPPAYWLDSASCPSSRL